MSRKRTKAPAPQPVEIGIDGWPVGDRNPEAEALDHRVWLWRYKQRQQQLANFKQAYLQDRYFPALMDALEFCITQQLPLPDWLGQHVKANLSHFYSTNTKLWKRCERVTAKREMHLRRYAEIEEARIHGVKWDTKDSNIFEVAAQFLKENPATIRRSYKKVSAALKRGDAQALYVANYRRRPIGVGKATRCRRWGGWN